MVTVSSLLNEEWFNRYKEVSKLNFRSSVYDITNKCNLKCNGCFFYSSKQDSVTTDETDINNWKNFVNQEKERGVSFAILIGGEPALYLDRVEAFYNEMPTYCATNGTIQIPRERFPDMIIGISIWGDEDDEKKLRGENTFLKSSKYYGGDNKAYYLYAIAPDQVGRIENVVKKIKNIGSRVHLQLLSNDTGVDSYFWSEVKLKELKLEMDEVLEKYPETVISTKYYHEIISTGKVFDKTFCWDECPCVSEKYDNRTPAPKKLNNFIRWASDLQTTHRCGTSSTRDCSICKDSAAYLSWVMVNKRNYISTTESLQNWIEIFEMFKNLYNLG